MRTCVCLRALQKRERVLAEGPDWVAMRKKKGDKLAPKKERERRRRNWARRLMAQVLFLSRLSSLIVEASRVGLLGGAEVVVLQSADPGMALLTFPPAESDDYYYYQ